jgi:hypothetical protein
MTDEERDELLARLEAACKRDQVVLQADLDLYKAGARTAGKDGASTTARAIADVEQEIAKLQRIIASG